MLNFFARAVIPKSVRDCNRQGGSYRARAHWSPDKSRSFHCQAEIYAPLNQFDFLLRLINYDPRNENQSRAEKQAEESRRSIPPTPLHCVGRKSSSKGGRRQRWRVPRYFTNANTEQDSAHVDRRLCRGSGRFYFSRALHTHAHTCKCIFMCKHIRTYSHEYTHTREFRPFQS